jgi:hypothetical protein
MTMSSYTCLTSTVYVTTSTTSCWRQARPDAKSNSKRMLKILPLKLIIKSRLKSFKSES